MASFLFGLVPLSVRLTTHTIQSVSHSAAFDGNDQENDDIIAEFSSFSLFLPRFFSLCLQRREKKIFLIFYAKKGDAFVYVSRVTRESK